MKKIAVVSSAYYSNIWNGQGRHTFSIAYALTQKGYDVTVYSFIPTASKHVIQNGQIMAVQLGVAGNNSRNGALSFADLDAWNQKVYAEMSSQHFDIIVMPGWHGWKAARRYAREHNAKLVGFVPYSHAIGGFMYPLKDATLAADIINTENQFMVECDSLVTHVGLFGEKVAAHSNRDVMVLPNCHFDLSETQFDNDVDKVPFSMLVVGRLAKEKNIEMLIRAMEKIEEVKLSLTSPDGSKFYFNTKLHNLAKTLKIDNRVNFLGYKNQREVMELYRTSELAVVTSQHEPYGYPVLDPMAFGCNVITSAWNGLGEYNVPEFYSVETLINSIVQYFTKTSAERSAMIDANRHHIRTTFSETAISNLLEMIILQ